MYLRFRFDDGFGSLVLVSFRGRVALAREQFPRLMWSSSFEMRENVAASLNGPGRLVVASTSTIDKKRNRPARTRMMITLALAVWKDGISRMRPWSGKSLQSDMNEKMGGVRCNNQN